MAVKIGHASIDERGKISGGKAGDQNGKEVYTRNWYKHSKGWYTVIPTDPEMLEYIAEAMEHACANPDIGYDQGSNRTLWNNVKPYGYDPAKTTKAVETDCAELAALCAQYALAKTGKNVVVNDSYSADLADNLVKTGYFKKLTADKYTNQDDYLLRGAIQTTRSKGHVWVILSNGKKASLAEFYGTEKNTEKNEYKGKGIGTAVAKSSMNVRSGAATNYSSYGTIKKSAAVEVLEILNSGWYKIVWPDASCGYAYVSNVGGKYFTYAAFTGSVSTARKVRIVNGNCNARSAPNTQARILGTAYKGQTFEYQGQTSADGWHLIEYKSQNAWVSGNYSKLED